eukprot:5139544-Pleurochrysis_carterae.AAC.3
MQPDATPRAAASGSERQSEAALGGAGGCRRRARVSVVGGCAFACKSFCAAGKAFSRSIDVSSSTA